MGLISSAEGRATTEQGVLLMPPAAVRRRWAITWFFRGLEFEDAGALEEAAAAYRAAAESDGEMAEAHFNLGNVLRDQGQPQDAEGAFRRALAVDSRMAAAWYNLADLQEERGDLRGAIQSLRQAVGAEPDFSAAHFNLALCLQATAQFDEARRQWVIYLGLDPDGQWAATARRHLKALSAMGAGPATH